MELGRVERSELLATLVADHGAGLAGLELSNLSLGRLLVILLSLLSLIILNLFNRFVLVLLQPFESSLN